MKGRCWSRKGGLNKLSCGQIKTKTYTFFVKFYTVILT